GGRPDRPLIRGDDRPTLLVGPRPASPRSFGRIAFLRVVEDQDPIIPVPLRRPGELARPGVGVLADLTPRPVSRVVPPGLDLLAGTLVHLKAEGAAERKVRQEEAPVPGPRRLDMVLPLLLARGDDRLVRDEPVPGSQFEQTTHQPHLAGALVGDRLAP